MQARQKQSLSAFERVQGFLDANDNVLHAISQTGARATLDDVVTILGALAGQQDPTGFRASELRAMQRQLRSDIITKWMTLIARIARASTEIADAEARKNLRVAPSGMEIMAFVHWARGMADVAGSYASVFTAAALPADFVEQFTRDIDALAAVALKRALARGARKGATMQIKAEITRGLAALRIIDAVITPYLQAAPGLKTNWESMKSIVARSTDTPVVAAEPADPATPVLVAAAEQEA